MVAGCCEEEAGGQGAGRLGSYCFAHELIRDVVYTELGEARRHFLHQRALARLETEGAAAAELAYHALAAGEAATIIQGLAEDIGDAARRSHFLAAPPIQQVVQQAQGEAIQVPKGRAEQSGR